jgi:hypothetical protein
MSNFRVHYPVHYVALGPYCSASGTEIHGLQNVSMTTSYNLEQVFELGQLEIYENIENVPDVEMTISKVLDGHPLIYHLATPDASQNTLVNRSNKRCDAFLSIFSDEQDNASGTPIVQAYASGMYINSLSYNLPVEGNCTEDVTLIGNDKLWISGSGTVWSGKTGYAFNGHFTTGEDSPFGSENVQRRQMVKMGAAPTGSIWPKQIPGMTTVAGSGFNLLSAGQFGAHLQDVTLSVSLNREDLFELGRRKPYYRYASFPTAVDCTINLTAGGTLPGDMIEADSDADNLVDEPIVIKLEDSTIFDLGNKNKLLSVTYSGGDTGGGVATIAYNYQNFNRLNITADNDPAGL